MLPVLSALSAAKNTIWISFVLCRHLRSDLQTSLLVAFFPVVLGRLQQNSGWEPGLSLTPLLCVILLVCLQLNVVLVIVILQLSEPERLEQGISMQQSYYLVVLCAQHVFAEEPFSRICPGCSVMPQVSFVLNVCFMLTLETGLPEGTVKS